MTYIIAEIGSTHDGSLGNAKKSIEVFAEAGADCVKFQCHTGQVVPAGAPRPDFFRYEDRSKYFRRTDFEFHEWEQLIKHARWHDVDWMCSVFSNQSAQKQRMIGCRRYKVPSGQVTNVPLLTFLSDRVEYDQSEVWISNGMCSREELERALDILGHPDKVHPMECVSEYPASPEHQSLDSIRLGDGVGFSDHSSPDNVGLAVAAAALGAPWIERHVTLSRHMYGSDAWNALEPKEFEFMVQQIRYVDRALASRGLDKVKDLAEAREVFLHKEAGE